MKHTRTIKPAITNPQQIMLSQPDLKMLAAALAAAPQGYYPDAERVLGTLDTANGLLRASGAGVVALQPVKSLGGIG